MTSGALTYYTGYEYQSNWIYAGLALSEMLLKKER